MKYVISTIQDKISQYNPSDDPVYKDYLPTSALGSKKILKVCWNSYL